MYHYYYTCNPFKYVLTRSLNRPERGSFPLDHDAECKHLISSYLRCLKSQNPPGENNPECRTLAKGYLACRMEKGLMAKDEWQNLGLSFLEDEKQPAESTQKKDD